MAALENDIKRVNEKLQQLLKQYMLLQKENRKLQEELRLLVDAREQNQQKIELLQVQVGLLKSASAQMSEADKKDFEKRINQYLRDIDKCIAILSE